MKFFIKLLKFLFTLLIVIGGSRTYSQDCNYCCKRIAVLGEFVNLHNPDFDEEQAEWTKCMDSQLKGITVFDPEDPRYKEAVENCKHLEPESWENMYPTSVQSKLTEVFTSEYFHMISKDHKGKQTEYMFKGSYEANINGTSGRTEQVKSRFILELYYNGGKTQELIKKWITEGNINSIPAHYRKMFDNSDAKTRNDRPINEKLLWEFEKIPVECKIEPEKEHLGAGEKMKIELKDFKDRKGRSSREFNRIVIKVKEGKILNGEKSNLNPDYRVFIVGNGTISALYEAPESCDKKKDMIYVYNACDVLDPSYLPLSETETNTKIAEKEIKICPRILEVDCVWSTDYERFPQSHVRWGGKAHIEIFVEIVDTKINGYTVQTLKGNGKGSQECWVKIDSPEWIENLQYSKAIDVSIKGTPLWTQFCNFLLTTENAGLSWDEVEDRDGMEYRWPNQDLGLQKVLSIIIFSFTGEPDEVFKESDEDILKTHYDVTARWKN